MKREDKKSAHHQKPTAQPVSIPQTPSSPQSEPMAPKTRWQRIKSAPWANILSALSLAVSITAAIYAYCLTSEANGIARSSLDQAKEANGVAKDALSQAKEANSISQATLDRTAGRTRAKFELMEEKERDPERDKPFLRKRVDSDRLAFRIESADEIFDPVLVGLEREAERYAG